MSDNREHILDQALALFAARGYDAVGVQQVVEAAGLTKPTLYHYFGSKKGLFEALMEERSGPLLEAAKAAAVYQKNVTLTITRLTAAYFKFAMDHREFYRLLLSTWFAPPSSEIGPVIRTIQERQHRVFAEMFHLAAADHGNMRGRHERYALSLRGLIDTYIGLWLQGGCDLGDHGVLFDVVHQFMHGIFS